jgi:hypothetical protein
VFKKSDLILLTIVLFLSSLFLVRGFFFKNDEKADGVVVRISGEEVYHFSQPGEWKIHNKNGKYVTTLHFDGQKVWVTDSNCPDKICEKTGKVEPGGSIICVPNRTIIEFKKKTENIDVETW